MYQAKYISVSVCVFLFLFGSSKISNGQAKGVVCVAPVAAPNSGLKSLSNPAGGNKIQAYAIQIDKLPKLETAKDENIRIGELSLSKLHYVKIFGDGKPVESFRFNFNSFKSSQLCLQSKSLYQTWSLIKVKQAGKSCRC